MTKLISKLVSAKTSDPQGDLSANSQIDTAPQLSVEDIWDTLADRDLYRLSIEIDSGLRLSARLDAEDLGLDPHVVDELAGGYRKAFSEAFTKARNQLSGLQKKFNKKFTIYVKPFRFIDGSIINDAVDFAQEIKKEAASLRQGLVDTYTDQLKTFLVELEQKLNETIPGKKKQIEKALIYYAGEFPSIDDFSGSLQVIIDGPVQLTSLKNKLKADADLQAELAKKKRLTAKQKKEAQEIQERIKTSQLMLNGIAQAVQQSRVACLDEGWELLADLIDRFGASPDGKLTSKDQSAISSTFSRLELLEKHNPEISKHLAEARKLHEVMQGTPTPEQAQDAYDKFSGFLAQQSKSASGEGAEKLQKSLQFTNDYKALVTKLEKLIETPDAETLAELEAGQLANIETTLTRRVTNLKRLTKKAQESAKYANEQAVAHGGVDPVVGF
ncbi:hypothetical protein [Acaryochloris marina]|uniref:hypothetical protein n=1 Tax=Acaryochloris marina TaxID=155978 RepID=UPI0021C266CF|nr:hypothetical protein [Acaryochloris marina]BDM82898.1 hypothetical protein AM10699_57590 [Acaryochloris marina MBIC10699]